MTWPLKQCMSHNERTDIESAMHRLSAKMLMHCEQGHARQACCYVGYHMAHSMLEFDLVIASKCCAGGLSQTAVTLTNRSSEPVMMCLPVLSKAMQ